MTKTSIERQTCAVRTAACLIIGDEVLGGKIVDTNSAFFAKWCFNLGIDLKRIEVIADEEDEIAEAVARMSAKYDFVVTSGGIGPTHDDITYQSIGKGFGLPLTLHDYTMERMAKLTKPHPSQPNFSWTEPSPALKARQRMALFPLDTSRPLDPQLLYLHDDMWVPVVVVNGNVHILPGIPQLFTKLLAGLEAKIAPRVDGKPIHRVLISTPLSESAVAEYLTVLAGEVEPKGVKVGSYPRFNKSRNTVTLVGSDEVYLESLVDRVVAGVQGRRVQVEGEDDEEPVATEVSEKYIQ